VRVSVERLDELMNLVGELVTNRTRLAEVARALRARHGRSEDIAALDEALLDLGRVVDRLQGEVMQARMLPVSRLFNKFPRLVRDVARAAGKDVNLLVEGETTELDRSVIEAIGDPLMHLLRNAVDHGIEPPSVRAALGKPRQGTVRLAAAQEEGHIVITVEDDGRGIDPAAVRAVAVRQGMLSEAEAGQLAQDEAVALIFRPRFTTAEEVTRVSGRGVGLDVVQTNVQRIGGAVMVESAVGRGTTFRLTLPLTLAITSAMLVHRGSDVYAIPLAGILESLYQEDWPVSHVQGRPIIQWRDQALPLLPLREFFADDRRVGAPPDGVKPAIVVVAWGQQRVGLGVDGLIGKQEIVVKPLGGIVGSVPGLSGCTVLGDGRVALIVDVPGLMGAAPGLVGAASRGGAA
jgi:two-component system chemotaxis sensor kinase CheA